MKKIFTLLTLTACFIGNAQPTVLGTNLADGNNPGFNYQLYNQTLKGTSYFGQTYSTMLQAASGGAAGTRKWEFFQGTAGTPDYANNWRPYQDRTDLNLAFNTIIASNTTAPPIVASTATFNSASGGAGGWFPAITTGNWYTVNITPNGAGQNASMAVLETTYQPTAFAAVNPVTYASASGSNVYPGQPVTITVTMAAQPQPGERVYIRRTGGGDIVTEITNMAGGVGSVVVPGNLHGASNGINFYAFTAPIAVANSSQAALLALRAQTNAGNPYTYTVAAGWTTAQDGDWSTPATWVGNDSPPVASGFSLGNFTINHNVSNNLPNFSGTYFCGGVSVAAGKTLSMNGGASLNAASYINGAGTLVVAGTAAIGAGGTGMLINTIQHNSTAEIQVSGGTWNVPNYTRTSNGSVRLSGTTSMVTGGTFYSLGIQGTLQADIAVLASLFTYSGTITAVGNRTITIGQPGTSSQLIANLGGGFQGVDAGVGNNINLVVTGQEVIFSTANGAPSIDLRKFFTITVQAGSKLSLQAGIMAKYGSFTVNPNGKLQINNGGFVESTITDSKPASYNQAELIYNHTAPEYTQTIGEWSVINPPSTVTISSAGVKMTGSRSVDGLYMDGPLNLDGNTLTIANNGSIFRRAAAALLSAPPVYGTSSGSIINVYIFPSALTSFNSGNELLGTMGSINLLFINNTNYTLQNHIVARQVTVNSGVFICQDKQVTLKTGGSLQLISNAEVRTSNPEGLAGNALASFPNTNNPVISLNGIVGYNSADPQKISPLSYVNLNLQGGRKYLAGDAFVSGYTNFNSQCLLLTNNFTLELGTASSFQNISSSTAFLATALEPAFTAATSGGVKKSLGTSNLNQLIPIGNYNSSNQLRYTPVRMSNTGVTDDFTFRCRPGIIPFVGLYTPSSVNNTWDISESTAGGSVASVELIWPQVLEGAAFTRTSCGVVHSNGSYIDQKGATGSAANNGGGNWSITGLGFTGFSPFGVTSNPTILPLADLLQFNAMQVGDKAQLNWTVSTGFAATFILEHGTDGSHFSSIGTVLSNNNIQYNLLHQQPMPGKNYYRLLVKEPGGREFYSAVKLLSFEKQLLVVSGVFPNPFAGSLQLQLYSATTVVLPVMLTDIHGKMIWQKDVRLSSGNNQLALNLPAIPAGNYILSLLPTGGNPIRLPVVRQ
ncbi:MAG: hypothetical protein V4722_09020 [Bacteroidota bacterium]